jgi:alginate O-acetyltransferase complex protein AlgI
VFWGAYHGLLLVAYRLYGRSWDRLPTAFRRLCTFVLVIVGWVFFRSPTFSLALKLLISMFVWTQGTTMPCAASLLVIILVSGALAHQMPNTFEMDHRWRLLPTMGLSTLFVLCVMVIMGSEQSPFLYFQF